MFQKSLLSKNKLLTNSSHAPFKTFCCLLALLSLSQASFGVGEEYDYKQYITQSTDGVLRHSEEGNPFRSASQMGVSGDGLVILVGASEEYEAPAIAHAHKLAKWFEDHPQTPSKVPIVFYRLPSKGVTYCYVMADGLSYRHKRYAPEGFLKAEDTAKVL